MCPVEDLRKKGAAREGMLENFSLGGYLLLVDWTSRLDRHGKTRVSQEVSGILERLGTSAEYWEQRLKQLLGKSRLLGSYFATSRERLKEIATHRGEHHVGLILRRDKSLIFESVQRIPGPDDQVIIEGERCSHNG